MTTDYFSFINILPAIFWLIVIFFAALIINGTKENKLDQKYYLSNILMKLTFGILFSLVYIFMYGGGDTKAYFDGAVAMNNLFFKSPSSYFEQLLTSPELFDFKNHYDSTTGFPPGWIYREPEAFFVSKLISILSFFTLKSYFAMTLIISTFTAHASWKLYQLVRSYEFTSRKLTAFGILFLPSVNFWCSGISKDTIVFIASTYLIYNAFTILSTKRKSGIINYIAAFSMGLIIYHTRTFVLLAILAPLFFSVSARFIRALGGGNMSVIGFRTIIFIVGIVGIGRIATLQSEQEFIEANSLIEQASIIQKDFQMNEMYGRKKYDLGEIEFTAIGLVKVMPLAIITGIYMPFIWEALNPTLLMNGVESVILLYLTFQFFRRRVIQKWNFIRGHEFLIFCFIFILIIAFMTGLTSVLYGVLVRLRAPLLPFLVVLLTTNYTQHGGEEISEQGGDEKLIV